MAAEANIVKRTLKKTALYKAVRADDLPTIQKLLKENPGLIFTDYMHEDKQRGLLYIIFILEKVEIAKMLMNAHPEDFKLAVQKDTDLLGVAFDKDKCIDLVDILIQNGVDVDSPIRDKGWPIMPLNKAVEKTNTVLVEMLIKAGAKPNEHTIYYPMPLYDAVRNNKVEIAKILIKAGADVNAEVNIGGNLKKTTLDWAVQNHNTKLIKILIDAGANLYHGNRFLKMAVKKNNIELVKILIKAGADVDLQRFNLERIYNPISNEMRTVLADYPSHLARKQEIRELWKPVEEVEKLAEDKSLSIQNDEPVVAAKDEQEILPNPSIASLSDNNQTFFYTNLIQWLPREVLEDTLDLIVFSEFSQRKRML